MAVHPRKIYLNLAVNSLEESIQFYTALGWIHDPTHSNETLAHMALPPMDDFKSGAINVMLLNHDEFRSSTPKGHVSILDAKKDGHEVFMCLSAESKEEVEEWMHKAEKAGARLDVGFSIDVAGKMFARSFEDLDGHVWEVMWSSTHEPGE